MPAYPSRVAPAESRACWIEAPGPRRDPARGRSPRPGPARCWCARCTAASAAAPSCWCSAARCRPASSSACARRSRPASFPAPVKYGYASVGVVEQGPRGAAAAARCSACIRTRPATWCRPRPCTCCPTACRPRAPCWPPTWRPPSTRCGMRRRASATASRWSARGVVGLLVGVAGRRACRAARSSWSTSQPARRAVARALGVAFAQPGSARRPMPTW